jgi:hypothetical protein
MFCDQLELDLDLQPHFFCNTQMNVCEARLQKISNIIYFYLILVILTIFIALSDNDFNQPFLWAQTLPRASTIFIGPIRIWAILL